MPRDVLLDALQPDSRRPGRYPDLFEVARRGERYLRNVAPADLIALGKSRTWTANE